MAASVELRSGWEIEKYLAYPMSEQVWRVADSVSGDGTYAVDPLVLPTIGSGYWVSKFDASYGE